MLEFTENMGQRTNLEPTATLTLTWELSLIHISEPTRPY